MPPFLPCAACPSDHSDHVKKKEDLDISAPPPPLHRRSACLDVFCRKQDVGRTLASARPIVRMPCYSWHLQLRRHCQPPPSDRKFSSVTSSLPQIRDQRQVCGLTSCSISLTILDHMRWMGIGVVYTFPGCIRSVRRLTTRWPASFPPLQAHWSSVGTSRLCSSYSEKSVSNLFEIFFRWFIWQLSARGWW
jgi:hypothetical protein